MDKINTWPAVVAATITTSIVYILCAILFVISPIKTLSFFNNWFHGIDLTIIAKDFSLGFISFFTGLISIIFFTAIFTLIFVWIYNLCTDHCKNKGWT